MPLTAASTSVLTMLDRNPALEGSSVNLSCPPGLVLTGPNTTTCMGNGEWEPDPMEAMCTSKP